MSKLLAQVPLGNIGGLNTGYQAYPPGGAPRTIEIIATNVVGFLTLAGGLAFIVYVLLAGLTWITARDESERISKAKQMLTNAIIGLAIVVAAWAITGVLGKIFGFEILNPAAYIQSISP